MWTIFIFCLYFLSFCFSQDFRECNRAPKGSEYCYEKNYDKHAIPPYPPLNVNGNLEMSVSKAESSVNFQIPLK